MTNEQDLPTWLRQQCGHDSRSVPECGHCEAADEIERRDKQLKEATDHEVEYMRKIEQLENRLQHIAESGCPYETCVALAKGALEGHEPKTDAGCMTEEPRYHTRYCTEHGHYYCWVNVTDPKCPRCNAERTAPPPPDVLAGALQDVVHKDTGAVRAGRSVKHEPKPNPFDSAAILGDPHAQRLSMIFETREQYEAALAFLDMADR